MRLNFVRVCTVYIYMYDTGSRQLSNVHLRLRFLLYMCVYTPEDNLKGIRTCHWQMGLTNEMIWSTSKEARFVNRYRVWGSRVREIFK